MPLLACALCGSRSPKTEEGRWALGISERRVRGKEIERKSKVMFTVL